MLTSRFAARWACAARRGLSIALVLVAAASTSRAQQPGTQVVGAVALAGYQPVMDDANYAGALAGVQDASQILEGMLGIVTGGQGLKGVDQTRPWGVILNTDGVKITGALCVPVNDFQALVSVGQRAGLMPEEQPNGVRRLSAQGRSFFVKGQGDWAYFAQDPSHLDTPPQDPAATFAPLLEGYDIALSLDVQKAPPLFRKMLIGNVTLGMEQALQREPQETQAEFEQRRAAAQSQVDGLQQLLEDLQTLQAGLAVNQGDPGLTLDATLKAVPGSALARQVPQETGSRFGAFLKPDPAITVGSAYRVSPEALERTVQAFEAQSNRLRLAVAESVDQEESLPNAETRDTIKAIFEDLLAAAGAMIRSGEFDMVASAQVEPAGLSVLAALATPEPGRVDAALKKAAALTENDPRLPQVAWAAETFADVDVHTLSVEVSDRHWRQVLGPLLEVAVGIGQDAVYLAVGPSAVQDLAAALNSPSGPTPIDPLQLSLSVGRLMQLAAETSEAANQDSAVPRMMAQLLEGGADDKITWNLSSVTNGVHYRLSVGEGVLKAAGGVTEEMRDQMAP